MKVIKIMSVSMLAVLLGLVAGCHYQSVDRHYGRGYGSYRDGYRDGRAYEPRRDTWRDRRYDGPYRSRWPW